MVLPFWGWFCGAAGVESGFINGFQLGLWSLWSSSVSLNWTVFVVRTSQRANKTFWLLCELKKERPAGTVRSWTSKVDWVHRLLDLLPLDLLYSSPPGFNSEVDGCKQFLWEFWFLWKCWWVFKEPGCLSTGLLFCSNLKGGVGSPMVTLSCVIPGRPWHAPADE